MEVSTEKKKGFENFMKLHRPKIRNFHEIIIGRKWEFRNFREIIIDRKWGSEIIMNYPPSPSRMSVLNNSRTNGQSR